jgi:hypothetical protein
MNKQYWSHSRIWALALLILAFTSVGCGLSGVISNLNANDQPTATHSVHSLPTFTPTAPILVELQPTSNNTGSETTSSSDTAQTPPESTEPEPVEPSPTPPPPSEPTNTPEPQDGPVTVTVQKDMNVRGGPGTNYPVLGTAPAGASSTVVGRNADNSWLQVQYPPGSSNTGWVYAGLVDIKGNPEAVAIAKVDPPPAAPPPPPSDPGPAPTPTPKYQFTPTAWHANGNEAIIHFRGTILDEGGNAVNGFSVLVDNGSWSVLAHPTGASHHYPEKPDGEWDVVIPDVRTGIGWWTLTVVSYDCPSFEIEFNAQCKQFTRLSEDIKVEVVYPDETIIWADWTCHFDCNKGLYVEAFRRK